MLLEYDRSIIIMVFILATAIWLFVSGLRDYRFSKKVRNIPTSKVGSAAVGLVDIDGRAKCKKPELSPVSKTPCVFWKVTVHEYMQYAREQDVETPLVQCESDKPFYVQDDTGRMLVDPAGAEIDIHVDRKYEGYIRKIWSFIPGTRHKLDATAMQYIETLDEPVKKKNQTVRIYPCSRIFHRR